MSRKNRILGSSEPEKPEFFYIFIPMSLKISCLAELSMEEVLITSAQGQRFYDSLNLILLAIITFFSLDTLFLGTYAN